MTASKMRWQLGWAVPSPDDIPEMELTRLLDGLNQAGYAGVEAMISAPYRMPVERFNRLLHDRGLNLLGVRTGDILTRQGLRLSDPDVFRRQRAVAALCDVIGYASAYGKPKILVGLMQGKIKDGEPIDQALDYIAIGLEASAATARRYGLTIALEPVNRYLLGYNRTIQQVLALISRTGQENLKILIDTFHMNIEEQNIAESVLQAGARIGDVHIADSNRLPPGKGHFDFDTFFNALQKTGYQGPLTVECDPLPDEIGAAAWSAQFLKKWMR